MSQATEEETFRAENLDRASELDRCAQEPIHIIGHIQPHGVLFAISEPDLIVRQVSANVSAFLGISPETLLDRTFEAVLGAQQFEIFRSRTLSQDALEENPLPIRLAGGALAVLCVAHRQDGILIVELELQEGAHSFEPLSLNAHIRLLLSRLELAPGISELSELAAREIRRLSGFDRVMIYRFDEEWNGEVIAESAFPSPLSYLGLHFPAADIPAQARRLFLLNRVRSIADVDASPVPIVPETGPLTGRPLNLTYSFLRSPAQIHLEYLRNMGVQSSLTVSIVARQQLWGLIACHHSSPHHVDYSTRSACELIGQVLGSQLALRMDNAALQLRLAFRGLFDNYLAQIDAPASLVFADCFQSQRLLELFGADGLVLSLAGVISAHGHSLEREALLPVIRQLRELSSNGIASSSMLSALDPGVISDASDISGALYLGLTGHAGDYLLLLRRALVTTVTWAGNPHKSVNTDIRGKLRPRTSFQAWQETVHARSRPWSELELEGARALRAQLLQRRASFESAWSEQRFRLLADTMPQLIWTARPDGSVDYCNQRWVSYTGNSLEQLIDRGWQQPVHPDDLSNCLERWKRTIATECDYELEYRIKRASDNAYRWHLVRAFPLRNLKAEIVSWVGAATDIEDQKQARRELERRVAERTAELTRAHQKLQSVLDGATNVSMIATDTRGLFTLFNAGAENLLGYTSEELVGRHTQGVIHLESEVLARGLELTRELGKPVQGFDVFVEKAKSGGHEEREWTYVRKDGGHLTVNLVVTALKDPAGIVTGFLGVAMDVSVRKQAEEALLKAGALQSAIFNSANFSSIATDARGVIQIFNVGAERMLGYKASEVVDQITPADISDPYEVIVRAKELSLELAAPITPGFEALVFKASRGIEDIYQLTYIRKDGSRFPAVVSVTALRDAQDEIIGYLLIGTDNTARKQAEEALLKAGALQSAIFNSANFSSIATDARGVIQIFNVGAERMLGYKASEVVDQITPADISDPYEVIVRAKELSLELATPITPGFEALVFKASRGIEDIYELTYIRKDGSRFPAVVSVTALRDDEGAAIGYLLIGTDNTARKKAETAWRESDVRFRTMVEAVPQMVWITRADGFNIYFSQKWMDYTGLTIEESLGHGWNKPFHPEDRQRAWEAWQQATKTMDGSYRIECRLRRADGVYRWFLILGVRQLDFDGTTLKWFGTCTDITLAKLSEGELKAANQELEKFAYVASHDLKAPLRAINKSAKWLEEDLAEHLTDETRGHLKVMNGRIKRMDKLLDDLMEYARIGRASDSRYTEVIRGDLLMEDVLALLPLEGFTLEVSPGFANIQVPRMPLQQILMNLIANSIKHHHKKTGRIAVTVENDGDFYAFAVKDDGPGISAQYHEQIFEMFRTLRPRDQVEGSGMGLAMVRKHIDVCGGTLRLESAPGRGSTFGFTWPKRQQLRKELE